MNVSKPRTQPTEPDNNIEDTLAKRGPKYGPYGPQVMVRRKIVDTMLDAFSDMHGTAMPKKYQEFIWDLANKMSRIACTPNHVDSWHDIQGYAKLVEKDLANTEEGV